ncbi:MAG: TrkA-N domain protein [Candidatus Parvarchaeum acidophilus ARMAN-5]|jgi:voltage-gated potassium channel|uniref:TrkA-N domain protein n=1 Tax=Candidatus Parvarchaeum acidophilus ARMAN-5 TaxID=662762 RepID=D6GVP5_PARA5|nr:MAG: TrkA-N domain protein [Candidatus Parvarchaeum acidophilus ARMAN-5]
MDQMQENGQKLLIAAIVLLLVFAVITVLISENDRIGFIAAVSTVGIALETFHFDSNFGILLLFFSLFLGVFAVYLLEFMISFIRNEFGGVIYMAKGIRFRNHYIICGGGRIGERIASLLKEKDKKVLIIENNDIRAVELKKLGFNVIKDNALEERTFKMANAQRAVGIFAALGQDVDNFIVVLNSKEINKNMRIVTRCNMLKNVNKFKELGADEVVLPEIVGADRMVYLSEKHEK